MTAIKTPYDLIIFDLDGVVTTEHIYWECARLTLWELLYRRPGGARPYVQAVHDAVARREILPDYLIFAIKNRAINSNWDLTYLGTCAMLAALPAGTGQGAIAVGELLAALNQGGLVAAQWPDPLEAMLDRLQSDSGACLLVSAGRLAAQRLGADETLLEPEGPWWQFLHERFQLWYSGLLMGVWGAGPLEERPVVPVAALRMAFDALREAGHALGIATGRPRDEALSPLRAFGVLDVFDPERVVTFTEVLAAQVSTGQLALGKPHPYAVRRALYPDRAAADLVAGAVEPGIPALVVGDSASDALAAAGADVPCLGVLSGVSGENARQGRRRALLAAGCVDVIDDITRLPGWLAKR